MWSTLLLILSQPSRLQIRSHLHLLFHMKALVSDSNASNGCYVSTVPVYVGSISEAKPTSATLAGFYTQPFKRNCSSEPIKELPLWRPWWFRLLLVFFWIFFFFSLFFFFLTRKDRLSAFNFLRTKIEGSKKKKRRKMLPHGHDRTIRTVCEIKSWIVDCTNRFLKNLKAHPSFENWLLFFSFSFLFFFFFFFFLSDFICKRFSFRFADHCD